MGTHPDLAWVVGYRQLLDEIVPNLFGHHYEFMDNEQFGALCISDPGKANAVYVSEILYRAHWAAATALLRSHRWTEGLFTTMDPANILAHASVLRGMLEACSDTDCSLQVVAPSIAAIQHDILRALDGEIRGEAVVWGDLEAQLIHFTYARKLKKSDPDPQEHRALTAAEYLDSLEAAVRKNSNELLASQMRSCYKALCELVHPSAMSIHVFMEADSPEPSGFDLVEKDLSTIRWIWNQYGAAIGEAFQFGINTPRMILGVLNKLGFAPVMTRGVMDQKLSYIRGWPKLAAQFGA